MAVPKRKVSRSRRGKRRAHDALKVPSVAFCANCDEPKMPHRICPSCGFYRGKNFIDREEVD